MRQKLLLFAALLWSLTPRCAASSLPIQLELQSEFSSRLTNIHVSYSNHISGQIAFSYGTCGAKSRNDSCHVFAETNADSTIRDSRLVWIIPHNATPVGCISAWDEHGALVGRSEPQELHSVKKRANGKRLAGKYLWTVCYSDIVGGCLSLTYSYRPYQVNRSQRL